MKLGISSVIAAKKMGSHCPIIFNCEWQRNNATKTVLKSGKVIILTFSTYWKIISNVTTFLNTYKRPNDWQKSEHLMAHALWKL